MPVKFYKSGNDPNLGLNLIKSFEYVLLMQDDYPQKRFIINLSYQFSGSNHNGTLFNKQDYDRIVSTIEMCVSKGIVIIASAGNTIGQPVSFPANLESTICVSELKEYASHFTMIGVSNMGPEVDVSAPGNKIYTTSLNHSYDYFLGTSAAVPVVSGIVALWLSYNRELAAKTVKEIVQISAERTIIFIDIHGNEIPFYQTNPEKPPHSVLLGYGRINCYAFGKIKFANNLEGANYGQIKVKQDNYSSGIILEMIVNSKIEAEIFSDNYFYNGNNFKFYKWKVKDINNNFRIRKNQFYFKDVDEQVAYYNQTKPLTVRNYLEGGSGGYLYFGEQGFDFRDRPSPYLENAFIYNEDNVRVVYQSQAELNLNNVLGTNWKFVEWSDGESAVRIDRINNDSPSELVALYKATNHSDNANAFNNSKRNFIRTPDGNLHLAYSSLGRTWYERSSNNGLTWSEVANFGSIKYPVLMPNIDYYVTPAGEIIVMIAYVERSPFGDVVYCRGYQYSANGLINELTSNYALWRYHIDELIFSMNNHSEFFFVTAESENDVRHNLRYFTGKVEQVQANHYTFSVIVEGEIPSTTRARDITLSCNKSSTFNFHIAWEDGNDIYYSQYNQGTMSNPTNISYNVPYPSNINPSVMVINDTPHFVWKGIQHLAIEGSEQFYSNVIYRNLWTENYHYFGSKVHSPSINKADNNYFAIAWSENEGSSVKYVDNMLNTIHPLNGTGKDVQLSGGANKFSMFAESFNRSSLPYKFKTSHNLGAVQPSPINSPLRIAREGGVHYKGTNFFYSFGDITYQEESVKFVEFSSEAIIENTNDLNEILMSEPFDIYNGSQFTYSIKYGADTSRTEELLTGDEFISFGLFLVDADDGTIIEPLDNIFYTQNNYFPYENINYQVDIVGLESRRVRLKLMVNNNIEAQYSLNNSLNDNEEVFLPKRRVKNIVVSDQPITAYALESNYPNPFNPLTVIKYQTPKDGRVILKVYDLLGKEVQTLVNESKSAGRYQVSFDASNLSSGVYIYRMEVNGFFDSKKMLLIK